MRYFIELAYNGKAYHGWQIQPNAITVQETLENAISMLLRKKTEVVGAGRTDTGVHASQYFAHFEAEEIAEREKLIYNLNSVLPKDVAVYRILKVGEQAHARFDALNRSYEYRIIRHKNPFENETAHFVKIPLDVERMNRAAAILMQFKDFKCFSRSRTDVKTFNCEIMAAEWKEVGNLLVFNIKADRFLRNMVRAIVGTLLETGLGKISEEDLKNIIKSRDRQKAGTSVPAKALFLKDIQYPESIFRE